MRILIADDEPLFRQALKVSLARISASIEVVEEAADCPEALEKAEKMKPNLVLLDIQMPAGDGLKVAEKIKEFSPETQIVIITAHSEFEYAQRAIRCGVKDFLLKPVRMDDLARVIEGARRVKATFSPPVQGWAEHALVREAVSYLKKNTDKAISLNEIAGHVHLSPFYFSRLFKKVMSVNFGEYLLNIRLERAKELLLSNDWPVSNVAEAAGYSDPSYFAQIFKKKTGITPTEYRARGKTAAGPCDYSSL